MIALEGQNPLPHTVLTQTSPFCQNKFDNITPASCLCQPLFPDPTAPLRDVKVATEQAVLANSVDKEVGDRLLDRRVDKGVCPGVINLLIELSQGVRR
jgi:hypothetical protein